MGANAQTSVPKFTAGDVLTAANQNLSAGTGVPVFADTTTRDAAFGGAGEKVLAEGQLCYVENLTGDAQIQYYDGSTWNSLGAAGLTLISSTTIGTGVTSVNVPNAFSSTYDNYRIIVSGGAGSGNTGLDLTLGATATGYYKWAVYGSYSATTVSGANGNNAASWTDVGAATTNSIHSVFDLFLPNAAKRTSFIAAYGQTVTVGGPYFQGGFVDNATQYTDFTLTRNAAGVTITGGTIKVYGYRN